MQCRCLWICENSRAISLAVELKTHIKGGWQWAHTALKFLMNLSWPSLYMKFDDKSFPVHEWISNDLAQGHLVTGLLVRVFVFTFTSYHSHTHTTSTCLSQFIFMSPVAYRKCKACCEPLLFVIGNCSREPDIIESEWIFFASDYKLFNLFLAAMGLIYAISIFKRILVPQTVRFYIKNGKYCGNRRKFQSNLHNCK